MRRGTRRGPDLVGQRFGQLTIVAEGHVDKWRTRHWIALCDCGQTSTPSTPALHAGTTRSCGCTRNVAPEVRSRRMQRAVVSYNAAHTRVVRARGFARQHPCVDCGGQASDWCYDGLDCDELKSDHPKTPNCYYSLKIEHYEPRCRKCHKAYDDAVRHRRGGTVVQPRELCRNGHVLKDVGVHKKQDSFTCAECGRLAVARYQARRKAS